MGSTSMNIKCRNFTFSAHTTNEDGSKAVIQPDKSLKYEMGILAVIDKFVKTDDCREAKQVVEYIGKI